MDEKQEIDLEESKEDELEDDNESLFDFYVSKIDHAHHSCPYYWVLTILRLLLNSTHGT